MKKTSSLVLCATTAAAVALSSCKPSKPAEPATPTATPTPAAAAADSSGLNLKDPVATVNGEPISKAELNEAFDTAIKASGMKASDLSEDQKLTGYNQLLDELIVEKLISKASANITVSDADVDAELDKIKKNFPSEEEFNKQLAEAGQTMDTLKASIRKMIQQQRWLESQIASKVTVSDADAQAFYDSNKAEFEQGATVSASHILFMVKPDDAPDVVQKKLDAAKAAAARAKKEDFNKLAKELSEEPGASESGGDLGSFTKDKMVPEFANAAFTQKVGSVSQPVRTQFGWHVIKVTDSKPARTIPFAEVKDQVIAYLKNDQQRKAVQELLRSLRDTAKVDSTLPPPPATMPPPPMPGGPTGGAPEGLAPATAPATPAAAQ